MQAQNETQNGNEHENEHENEDKNGNENEHENEHENEDTDEDTDEDNFISEERKKRLKYVLTQMSKIEDQIQFYKKSLKSLKSQKQILSKESVSLMQRYSLKDAQVSDVKKRFVLRQRMQRTNPLIQKTLPMSLSQYFIKTQNMEENEAHSKSKEIIQWIKENLCEKKVHYNLRRYPEKQNVK